jgi:hypothetical protein
MTDTAFVERRLRLGESEVLCRFFRPARDISDFRCNYTIDWPDRQRSSYACGVDEVQALLLAMAKANTDLLSSSEYASGTLFWLDMREFGLPFPDGVSYADFK